MVVFPSSNLSIYTSSVENHKHFHFLKLMKKNERVISVISYQLSVPLWNSYAL